MRISDWSSDVCSSDLPVRRDSVPGSHPHWEYVLSPGRVWDEAGDNGYSRVALPFALQQKNANCMHNGVLTFLFKDDGSVSKVAYQIASETCLYFKEIGRASCRERVCK